jgi:hypothetical protein
MFTTVQLAILAVVIVVGISGLIAAGLAYKRKTQPVTTDQFTNYRNSGLRYTGSRRS